MVKKKGGRPKKIKSKLWVPVLPVDCCDGFYMVLAIRCYIVVETRIACNSVEFKMHRSILKKKYPGCSIKIFRFKGVFQYNGEE